MFTLPLLVALAAAQAPCADTLPLPPLDTAWTRPRPVAIRGVDLPDEVPVCILVDQWGRVQEAVADTSLGIAEEARNALERQAARLRFVPAQPGPGWSRMTVPLRAERPRPEPATPRNPEYADIREARHIVERYYPPRLRDAQTGGSVIVWVLVDELGVVNNVRIHRSSGLRDFDEAAERAAWEIEFTPGYLGAKPCSVWVALPITFAVRGGSILNPRPSREFALGPSRYPVADGFLTKPKDSFPELVRPDAVGDRLTRLFLDSGSAEQLGLLAEIEIDADGKVRRVKIWQRHPGDHRDSGLEKIIVEAIERFRFRPAISANEPVSVTLSAWFIFHEQLGLIPSVAPDSCIGADGLTEEPQFTALDEPAELATPTWERARIISETWPIAFQQEGRRYEYRLWYLIDERGRVCEVEFPQRPPDRFTASKVRSIAQRLRFKPALRGGTPVASWRQEILAFSF